MQPGFASIISTFHSRVGPVKRPSSAVCTSKLSTCFPLPSQKGNRLALNEKWHGLTILLCSFLLYHNLFSPSLTILTLLRPLTWQGANSTRYEVIIVSYYMDPRYRQEDFFPWCHPWSFRRNFLGCILRLASLSNQIQSRCVPVGLSLPS